MLQRIALITCMTVLSACTETGDSPYTYLDVVDVSVPDASGGVYWVHAEPLLTKACIGCHTGGASGGNNFGNVYEDNLKPSYYCQGKTVGECVLIRIDDNTMPPGGGANLTEAERAVLDAWVAAGMPYDAAGPPIEDVAPEVTSLPDAGEEDTGPEDTAVEDTTNEDTADSSAEDIGVEDIGVEDAGVEDAPGPTTPTFTNDIQPMLADVLWCAGCHTGGNNGGSNFASVYEDNLKPSYYCPGKTVGECILPRIDDNSMPPGGGLVVSDEERALMEDWIAAGMPE